MFWQSAELSAPDAHRLIEQSRSVTYSTVKTIIDRLEEKGALMRSAQHGRTIIYRAAIDAEQVRKPLVGDFLNRVFGGNRKPLFSHLLEDEALSDEDIEHIKSLLRKRHDGEPL